MQNRILLTILLVSSSLFSIAQLSAVGYKSDQYEKFIKTKTYVVKMDEFYFDGNMAEAMKDWKITPYEFITNDEFKAKISDKTASFILPVTIFTGTSRQEYHYLALINGGRKSLSSYDYNDMLAYAVINHFGNEGTNISCAHRLHNMISSMINAMELVKKNDIKGNPKKIVDKNTYSVILNFRGKVHHLQVPYPKRILEVALENKINLPYSCSGGVCSTCTATCTKGRVRMDYNEVLTDEEVANGRVLVCTGHPTENDTTIVWE